MNTKPGDAFLRLVGIMDELRKKCPWDRKQTIQSLRQMTIEETYELADAITDEDWQGIKEELGDLLLHILFYSKKLIALTVQIYTEIIQTYRICTEWCMELIRILYSL